MSIQKQSQTFVEQTKWFKDGDLIDKPPYHDSAYNGKITTGASAGDFNVTNRTNVLVEALTDAKKVLIFPPNGAAALLLRFRGDGGTGDLHVLQLFAASGVDHYAHFAQLTIEQGTQRDSGSIYFFDTVVSANEIWPTPMTELSTTSNYIGGYVFNTHGNDRFWIVASTLDTATMANFYIDWRVI